MKDVKIFTNPMTDKERAVNIGLPLKMPVRYHLVDCLRDLQMGRSTDDQNKIQKWIDELNEKLKTCNMPDVLTTELKSAFWQIANLAMDCHDNKLNGEQFEKAALNTLKQVKNIDYKPVLPHRFCSCKGHGYSETEKCTECNKPLPPY